MSVTHYGNGNITLITQDNLLLSPMVTDYAPTTEINTTSALIENVTMTGIDRIFKHQLSEANSIKLLNSFTVSGFKMDPTLGEEDPNMADLEVALSASGDFAEVIRDAIAVATDASDDVVNYAGANNGALDAAGVDIRIKQYLETRLRNAFFEYFASSLGATPDMGLDAGWTSSATGSIMRLSGENINVADEEVNAQTNASGGASGTSPTTAEPGTAAIGATYVQAETTLQGFSVGVDVSETAMGNACALRHFPTDMSENRRILFRQIRKDTWIQYYDGSGDRLDTNALPMGKGQSFVVVFDIDVAASSARSDSGNKAQGAETLPKIANAQTGDYSYQLNMGSRRVAFELQLDGTVEEGAFAVGAGGLRVDTGKVRAEGM